MAAIRAIDLTPATEAPRTSKATRLISIDFLRGGAALAVVLHHAINWNETAPQSLFFRGIHAVLNQGYLGVPLFFVVSGFCIHLRWAKRYSEVGQHKPDWG